MEEFLPPDNFVIQFKNTSDTRNYTDVELQYKGELNGVKKYGCHFINITGNIKSLLNITIENTRLNEAEILAYGSKYTKVDKQEE